MEYIQNLFNRIVTKFENWRIVHQASNYSICDIDINCSSCLYCSKKGRYCTNKNVYEMILDKEQYSIYRMTGHQGKKIKINFAVSYCKLFHWCFSPDIRKIQDKYYCFVYRKYVYSNVGWRECRFWLNEQQINIEQLEEILKNDQKSN